MIKEDSLMSFAEESLNEARRMMFNMLTKVVEIGGSDLFITAEFPPECQASRADEATWQAAIDRRKDQAVCL